eukprot:Rhum_TRINITY_DN14994_c1_g1::Rhum_TRINITY_DN14994_c1_g1_i2::g.131640::m.131640
MERGNKYVASPQGASNVRGDVVGEVVPLVAQHHDRVTLRGRHDDVRGRSVLRAVLRVRRRAIDRALHEAGSVRAQTVRDVEHGGQVRAGQDLVANQAVEEHSQVLRARLEASAQHLPRQVVLLRELRAVSVVQLRAPLARGSLVLSGQRRHALAVPQVLADQRGDRLVRGALQGRRRERVRVRAVQVLAADAVDEGVAGREHRECGVGGRVGRVAVVPHVVVRVVVAEAAPVRHCLAHRVPVRLRQGVQRQRRVDERLRRRVQVDLPLLLQQRRQHRADTLAHRRKPVDRVRRRRHAARHVGLSESARVLLVAVLHHRHGHAGDAAPRHVVLHDAVHIRLLAPARLRPVVLPPHRAVAHGRRAVVVRLQLHHAHPQVVLLVQHLRQLRRRDVRAPLVRPDLRVARVVHQHRVALRPADPRRLVVRHDEAGVRRHLVAVRRTRQVRVQPPPELVAALPLAPHRVVAQRPVLLVNVDVHRHVAALPRVQLVVVLRHRHAELVLVLAVLLVLHPDRSHPPRAAVRVVLEVDHPASLRLLLRVLRLERARRHAAPGQPRPAVVVLLVHAAHQRLPVRVHVHVVVHEHEVLGLLHAELGGELAARQARHDVGGTLPVVAVEVVRETASGGRRRAAGQQRCDHSKGAHCGCVYV